MIISSFCLILFTLFARSLAYKITTFPPTLQLFSQKKLSPTSPPYTLHLTLAAPLPIKPPFRQKKKTSILSEVLITINSERSKKVLLAQMVYDGSSITSSDNIEVPKNLTSRTSRIAADSLQQGCMSRDTKSFAEMVYPIDILLSVITNLPLYLVFYNRVSYLIKIWYINI